MLNIYKHTYIHTYTDTYGIFSSFYFLLNDRLSIRVYGLYILIHLHSFILDAPVQLVHVLQQMVMFPFFNVFFFFLSIFVFVFLFLLFFVFKNYFLFICAVIFIHLIIKTTTKISLSEYLSCGHVMQGGSCRAPHNVIGTVAKYLN